MAFTLVGMHPVTDKFIPIMATHWSVQSDQKTIYFKLDPDAKFSDGDPITADDYVFTWKMMQSKAIVDPFYNSYAERYFESVDKIDDYTLQDRRHAAELAAAGRLRRSLADAVAHDRPRRHLGDANDQRAADRGRPLCRLQT